MCNPLDGCPCNHSGTRTLRKWTFHRQTVRRQTVRRQDSLWTGQFADWTARRHDISLTGEFADGKFR